MYAASTLALEFPAPPKARVQQIAASTSALGMQLSIRRFDSDSPVEQVLAFYRELWDGEYRETEMPPWKMIGRLEDGHYMNVQVQPDNEGGSWGYLSIGDLPGRLEKQEKGSRLVNKSFPMMNGSTVLNEHVDNDRGRDARTLLISNTFSASSNHRFYRHHYQGRGWSLLVDKTVDPAAGEYALFFQQGSDAVAVTILRKGQRTYVLVNEVSRGCCDDRAAARPGDGGVHRCSHGAGGGRAGAFLVALVQGR